MGWTDYLDDIIDQNSLGFTQTGVMRKLKQLQKQRRGPKISLNAYRMELIEGLDNLDRGLMAAEFAANYTDKLQEVREALGKIRYGLTMPFEAVTTLEDLNQFKNAIVSIHQMDPQTAPEETARAWGEVIKGFGRLAQKLPPPASAVGVLLEEFGSMFHKIVLNINPYTRPVYVRGNEESKRGGIDLFYSP